ncbi:MAG: aminotransferase class IV [Candidatus Neomarinimicrobiota bacterium]|nr:aminotransferase class IV [Candidatus Neomarinimicrobiota bacterium]
MINALINNQWESVPEKDLQPGSDSFAFGTGLYETFRTLNHKPVFLEPHLDRLFKSAHTIDLTIASSQNEIVGMIARVVQQFDDPNQRARILAVPGKIIIYTSSLNLDPSIYKGVSTITVPALRKTPEIKTTDYTRCLEAYKIAENNDCFEAILLDNNNQVLEGSRSNIFWVQEKKLFTRDGDVLPGVTRQTVISRSPFSIFYGQLNQLDFDQLNEIFLTNSGSGIIPVVKINSIQIGTGKPGPITVELLKVYDGWLNNEI